MPPAEECWADPRMGCVEPSHIKSQDGKKNPIPVFWVHCFGEVFEIYRHYLLLQLKHINQWVEEYTQTSSTNYTENHPCWNEAAREYNYYLEGARLWLQEIQSKQSMKQ